MNKCTLPPDGWFCSRPAGHEGPCAASPVENDTFRTPDAVITALRAGNKQLRERVADLENQLREIVGHYMAMAHGEPQSRVWEAIQAVRLPAIDAALATKGKKPATIEEHCAQPAGDFQKFINAVVGPPRNKPL